MDEKKISGYLPFITIAIIALSSVKQFVYYLYFRIPISDYLTLSDVTFNLLGDLIMIGVLMILLSFNFISTPLFVGKKTSEELTSEQSWKLIGYDFLFVFALSFVMGVMSYILSKNSAIVYETKFWVMFYTMLIILALTLLYLTYKRNKVANLLVKSRANVFIIVFALLLYQLLMTAFDITASTRGKYKGTIVVTEDSSYISTDSSFYVGKTQDNVFIYNLKDSTSLVIPTSEIKKIKYRNKVGGHRRPIFN